MALKKPTPTFESNDQADVVETSAPAIQNEGTPLAVAPTAPAANASAVAVSKASAASAAKAFQKEFEELKGACDFSYGNMQPFKASQGAIKGTKDKSIVLGKWAYGRLIGWDTRFEISPGTKGASAKDFVAYSSDGITVDSVIGDELKHWAGKPVADYIEYLQKEEEFDQASKRPFVDLAMALLETESEKGPIGTVIQVTLSKTSMSSFTAYEQKLKNDARCVAMGLPGFTLPEDPFMFYLVCEAANRGDNDWTKINVTTTKPA